MLSGLCYRAVFILTFSCNLSTCLLPCKAAAVASEIGRCGCNERALLSNAVDLLHLLSLGCFFGLLVSSLSLLPLAPRCCSSILGTASVQAPFSADGSKGVAFGLESVCCRSVARLWYCRTGTHILDFK